jgi:hypothetical protein
MSDESDVREAPADQPQQEQLSTADLAGRSETRGETQPAPESDDAHERTPLFPEAEARDLRTRWDSLQASFVDEPRRAVEEADNLVATAMKRLAEQFAGERAKLEGQWDRGDDVSTEDLRIAMQRYRSFFGRLLAV